MTAPLLCDACGHDVDPRFYELYAAAHAFVHFSFERTPEEEAADAAGHARAHSSVPFVRVEQRLRRAVRAFEAP